MRAFESLTKLCAWIAALLFVLSGAMLTYEVLARYFFTKPTIWAAELSQMALIWGTLLAMAWALGTGRHIAVEAVVSRLSAKTRRYTECLAMLFVAFFSFFATWKGGEIFWDSFERGRTTGSMLDLPLWLSELAVPFGFALLLIQALIEAWRSAHGHFKEGGGQAE